jgi:hypothetical protein
MPRDGETLIQAVTRLRDKIIAAKRHLAAVKIAPLPRADQKALAAAHVKALAERGRPRVSVERDAFAAVFIDPRADFGVTSDYVSCVLAWLEPVQMLSALEHEIDALPVPQQPMPAAERQKREADLAADLDRLEREEEALIEAAAAQGTEIARRPDAAPGAVLSVAVAQAKAAAA